MSDTDVRAAVVLDALRSVYDGCCEDRKISIVDMGIVDRIEFAGNLVRITFVLTTGWCPFSVRMIDAASGRVRALAGIREVEIAIDWDKAWDAGRLAPDLATSLQLLPVPSGPASRAELLAALRTRPTGNQSHRAGTGRERKNVDD